jgi:hypothetical protein
MDAPLRNRTSFVTLLTWACLLGATASVASPIRAASQLISLKTVPVATGDQFLTLPSDRLGMGGVSIALDDALLDPFVNPAKGSLIEESTLFGSPTFYGVSNENGGGRTLPLAAVFRTENGFGGVSFALQQIEGGNDRGGPIFLPVDAIWVGPQVTLSELSATNVYADGVVGFELGESGLSLGAGVSWAGLDALDGVEHLYSRAEGLAQAGHAADYRLGIFSDRDGRQFEAVLVHNRFSMTHDVSYLDWTWDETDQISTVTSRLEVNEDKTNTTGLHLGFVRPVTESGWRVGGTWTVNRKSHPKIPNYEIVNIPRDPGISWAYDFGVGIAKTTGPATFGIDIVFEPIWSDTWQEAEADTTAASGAAIPEGGKTIENEFFFTNVKMRLGLAHETERLGFQMGVEVRSYDYSLEQRNNLENTVRDQNESWMEWTPSVGALIKFPEFRLSYVGRMTTGSGRPGVAWRAERPVATDASGADFIVAPSGPLTLQDARVLTHQLTVSIPIR